MTRSSGGISTVAWAVLGVLVGHAVTYGLLFPDAHVRQEVLADTGHAWVGLAWPVAIVAVLVALANTILAAHGGRGRGVRFATLAAIQVGAFLAMELSERFTGGFSVAFLDHQIRSHALFQILLVGSLIQVACAWLGSAVSRLVASIAETDRPTRIHRRPEARLRPPTSWMPLARTVRDNASRAPPRLALITVIHTSLIPWRNPNAFDLACPCARARGDHDVLAPRGDGYRVRSRGVS